MCVIGELKDLVVNRVEANDGGQSYTANKTRFVKAIVSLFQHRI